MNETVKNLVERKNCRKFRNVHITREEIEEIVAAGSRFNDAGEKGLSGHAQ